MAVTIPAANRVTQARRTTAPQTAVDTRIAYRDSGVSDIASGLVKSLGAAAARAEEAKTTALSNALFNEAERRTQKIFLDMQSDPLNKGYGSKDFVKRFRENVATQMTDLQQNGFTMKDGSKVAAPEENVWNNVVERMDRRLIDYDGQGMRWAANEFATRAKNDFDTSVQIALNTVLNSDNELVQASASNEIMGLGRAYFRGQISEDGLKAFARENMQKALGTRAKNKADTDPIGFLKEKATNKNYTHFAVDLSEPTKTAINNMKNINAMNIALEANGRPRVVQEWDDATAKAYMTDSEYADYSVGSYEKSMALSATIQDEIRRQNNELGLQYMIDASNVKGQGDFNDLVEKAVTQGTSNHVINTLEQISNTKNDAALYQQRVAYVDEFSGVDGEFNEVAARVRAGARAEAIGIGNELPPLKQEEARNDYIEQSVKLERARFYDERSKLDVESLRAPQSAEFLQDFYASLEQPGAPIVPSDVENFNQMTAADKALVTGTLVRRAELRKRVEEIERAEGGTFDIGKLALDQWDKAGKKYNPQTDEGDAEEFSKFSDRFKELYVREWKGLYDKPDAEGIARIGRAAFETYQKNPAAQQVYQDLNNLRVMARNTYSSKPVVTQSEMRDAIRDWMEAGWWGRVTANDGDVDKGTRTALRELYEDLAVPEQQLLVDAIAKGNDSLVYRLLETKGYKL